MECSCTKEKRCAYHGVLVECITERKPPPDHWPKAKADMKTLWEEMNPSIQTYRE